jgi:hypothetical protein
VRIDRKTRAHSRRENDATRPGVIAGPDPAIHEAQQRMKVVQIEFSETHHGLPGQARQ